jgi:hypothetical protein
MKRTDLCIYPSLIQNILQRPNSLVVLCCVEMTCGFWYFTNVFELLELATIYLDLILLNMYNW